MTDLGPEETEEEIVVVPAVEPVPLPVPVEPPIEEPIPA